MSCDCRTNVCWWLSCLQLWKGTQGNLKTNLYSSDAYSCRADKLVLGFCRNSRWVFKMGLFLLLNETFCFMCLYAHVRWNKDDRSQCSPLIPSFASCSFSLKKKKQQLLVILHPETVHVSPFLLCKLLLQAHVCVKLDNHVTAKSHRNQTLCILFSSEPDEELCQLDRHLVV